MSHHTRRLAHPTGRVAVNNQPAHGCPREEGPSPQRPHPPLRQPGRRRGAAHEANAAEGARGPSRSFSLDPAPAAWGVGPGADCVHPQTKGGGPASPSAPDARCRRRRRRTKPDLITRRRRGVNNANGRAGAAAAGPRRGHMRPPLPLPPTYELQRRPNPTWKPWNNCDCCVAKQFRPKAQSPDRPTRPTVRLTVRPTDCPTTRPNAQPNANARPPARPPDRANALAGPSRHRTATHNMCSCRSPMAAPARKIERPKRRN